MVVFYYRYFSHVYSHAQTVVYCIKRLSTSISWNTILNQSSWLVGEKLKTITFEGFIVEFFNTYYIKEIKGKIVHYTLQNLSFWIAYEAKFVCILMILEAFKVVAFCPQNWYSNFGAKISQEPLTSFRCQKINSVGRKERKARDNETGIALLVLLIKVVKTPCLL